MTGGKFNVALNEGHAPLAPDEPTFTFRAQDSIMADVLEFYALRCDAAGSPYEHVQAIFNARQDVIAWQHANGCRIPD